MSASSDVTRARPYLGIDAGGSSTRWSLVSEGGEEVVGGTAGPISAIQLKSGEAAAVLQRLDALLSAVGAAGKPQRVVAGVTGLDTDAGDTELLTRTIAVGLELPPERVKVLPDIHVAYLSAFRPGEGVVVYAGTGSVAFHLARDGSAVRAGGHGYLIDDAGGGYWIGRRALQLVLRRADEQGSPAGGKLASSLYGMLGGADWDTIKEQVYSGGRSKVASLARAVAHSATRGDATAVRVLEEAGAELARLARTVSGRLGTVLPVTLAGGVARAGAPLWEALKSELPAGANFTVSEREPVEAAAELSRVGWA